MASFRRSGSQTSEKGLPGAEDLCEIFVFVRESQLFEKRISCFEVPEAFSGISACLLALNQEAALPHPDSDQRFS